jgi:hypothetical protein
MQITTIGLDIAKNVFQVHGIDFSAAGRHSAWLDHRRRRRKTCTLLSIRQHLLFLWTEKRRIVRGRLASIARNKKPCHSA